jgi:nicotinamide mononucleotide transporter
MTIYNWISNNYIEIFGAVTGIVYVFLEIRQTIWLWPIGIITSGMYIWVFFTSKFYADMSLQVYYLIISILGWYWWTKGKGNYAQGTEYRAQSTDLGDDKTGKEELKVTRLKVRTGIILGIAFVLIYLVMWFVLTRWTDSPVPARDSFVTSLSIIATWMLARKIYEHWYLWIVVNFVSAIFFLTRGLYPTVILYLVYGLMSFVGLVEWKKTIPHPLSASPGGEGE